MNIKMIAVDLDGTLMRDNSTASERTYATLKRCRDQGIRVVCATGRGGSSYRLLPPEYVDGRVLVNGVSTYADGQLVRYCAMAKEHIKPFLQACAQRGLIVEIEYQGQKYANSLDHTVSVGVTYAFIDLNDYEQDAESFFSYGISPEEAEYIAAHLPQFSRAYFSRYHDVMIISGEASKASGLAKLAELWGIKPAEIVAFGDDINDIEMLQYAGIGVAMGNSVDEVKAIADAICLSNEEDGVALWLEEKILAIG